MKWVVRILGFGTLLVVVIAGMAFGYRVWRQHENAIALAIVAPSGVQEASFVRIGGIDQWISIRGEDRGNPILLFLHGGPGNSILPLEPAFRAWESHFTMVQWDQRGAGKTYGRNGTDERPMTVDRIVQDGIEVAEYLRKRLEKSNVVLLGHSWGTEIGMQMVIARPDLFSAYVGTGQVVSIREKETYIYADTLRRLRAAGDSDGIRALEQIGQPPYRNNHDLEVQRHWSERYDIPAERDLRAHFTPMVAFAPDFSLRDIYNLLYASEWTAQELFADEAEFDARVCCTTFQVPVFVFNGDHDTITPTELVRPWFDMLQAPSKGLVVMKDAGHSAVLAAPDVFLDLLLRDVRPVAVAWLRDQP